MRCSCPLRRSTTRTRFCRRASTFHPSSGRTICRRQMSPPMPVRLWDACSFTTNGSRPTRRSPARRAINSSTDFRILENSALFNGGLTARNAMGLSNGRWYLRRHFFWDERANTLEDQVLQPIQNAVEMGMTLSALTNRLAADRFIRTCSPSPLAPPR